MNLQLQRIKNLWNLRFSFGFNEWLKSLFVHYSDPAGEDIDSFKTVVTLSRSTQRHIQYNLNYQL